MAYTVLHLYSRNKQPKHTTLKKILLLKNELFDMLLLYSNFCIDGHLNKFKYNFYSFILFCLKVATFAYTSGASDDEFSR